MSKAIIPTPYNASDRSKIFGPANDQSKEERNKAQAKYRTARRNAGRTVRNEAKKKKTKKK